MYIAFEGGEGSGKGTVISLLKEHLEKNGKKVLVVREPGGTKAGEEIRNVLFNNNFTIDSMTEVMLFAAARSQLLSEILPLRDDYDYILLDRYVYSSYVYQGIVRGVGLDKVARINDIATAYWHPDKVIYLDIDPTEGLARIFSNNRETNKIDHESMEFHENVRKGYLSIANENDFKTVDASKSQQEVFKDVLAIVEEE